MIAFGWGAEDNLASSVISGGKKGPDLVVMWGWEGRRGRGEGGRDGREGGNRKGEEGTGKGMEREGTQYRRRGEVGGGKEGKV